MATLKTVYFCDSNPTVWFEDYKEAEAFDKVAEVSAHVNEYLANGVHGDVENIVRLIMNRYTLDKRYDYNPPAITKIKSGEAA